MTDYHAGCIWYCAGRRQGKMKHRNRAFTIIEALISIVVITLAIVSLLAMIPASYDTTEHDSVRLQAVTAGREYLDALQQSIKKTGNAALPPPPAVPVDAGDSFSSGDPITDGNLQISDTDACPLVPGSQALYHCTVTVTWQYRGTTQTMTLESYATKEIK